LNGSKQWIEKRNAREFETVRVVREPEHEMRDGKKERERRESVRGRAVKGP
jgi:hypothetical protein